MRSTSANEGPAIMEKNHQLEIIGSILEVDYLILNDRATIRLTIKGSDGRAYEVFDRKFEPYFYFVPRREMSEEEMKGVSAMDERGRTVRAERIVKMTREIYGKPTELYRIYTHSTPDVPKLSAAMMRHGACYEYDIPFAKRYMLDNPFFPLTPYKITINIGDGSHPLSLDSVKPPDKQTEIQMNLICFDIEVYNPNTAPRADRDPVVMISYLCLADGKRESGVLTTKPINRPFVEVCKTEKDMIKRFMNIVSEKNIDIVAGYNSANFDIRYMLERARALKMDFNLNRFEGDTKIERHGLVDKVKIAGRVHVDVYLVTRFAALVSAAEHIMRLNSYTLKNVYEAISKEKKIVVEKADIWKIWDGSDADRELLAEYNLNDSEALLAVYNAFVPIMLELTKTTGNPLSDVAVSTTGQLVEFSLMRYAYQFNEIIPNKPDDTETRRREYNPIEGAYVKTPDPGIYDGIVVFDFRGLYPSIIISHNIDPSSLCKEDCTDYFESPTGAKFIKKRKSVMPTVLKIYGDERVKVKKLYKANPTNVEYAAKSQALKIIANSLYGYLGYARSRYYSRECAESVTAYGRQYIKNLMSDAESRGLRVLYGDTDSVMILMNDKTKDYMNTFLKEINKALPETMELELEDFYTRGVFVGKKNASGGISGVKKKYALIAENGRIKIRGFELVRRDWSKIARDTQRAVLEAILKEGSKEKAVEVVKGAVMRLKEGAMPLKELAISTQIRKSIDSYDNKSPEVAAAKKAVQRGQKTKDQVEAPAVVSYIITKHGNLISDKAELEEFAVDYDPDYYVSHQVVPAAMRILKELDVDEGELEGKGKQRKLGG